jgi:hypothetical protein
MSGGTMDIKRNVQVLIVGGSLGACAAALSCGRMGVSTVMVTPDQWIGGQMTSQGVPPDEHPWIDSTGSTASYRIYRQKVRSWYQNNLPLHPKWNLEPSLNPGGGHVSPLTHDPRIGLTVLEEMILPYCIQGTVEILRGFRPIEVHTSGDKIREVSFGSFSVQADFVIDGTETGELLPLAGVEYRTGAESKKEFSEPHAPDQPNPQNHQAISWCAVLGWNPENKKDPVVKPKSYNHWKTKVAPFWPGPQLSFASVDPFSGQAKTASLFGGGQPGLGDVTTGDLPRLGGLWAYRRIQRPDLLAQGIPSQDMTVLNWPQMDYWEGTVVDNPQTDLHLKRSKELTLSFIHWLQTEAPRDDGSHRLGYPEIELRGDVFGTLDGLARDAYYRESRRIVALTTVSEMDIGVEARKKAYSNELAIQATQFEDSVGLASYRIDLHPSTGGDSYIDIESYPAQIPLGALIPVRMRNLIPGCKNLGTTHLSSGMYRVHPSEWNIGEAAGALASNCAVHGLEPRQVKEVSRNLESFQELLHHTLGFELDWPPHVKTIPRYQPQFQWILKEKRQNWKLS